MFPVAGGIARFPHYSYGSLAGFRRLVRVPRRGDDGADRGRGRAPVLDALRPWLTTTSGGAPVLTAQGLRGRGGADAAVPVDQRVGVRWLAGTNTAIVVVEGRDPGAHHRRAHRHRVPPAATSRRAAASCRTGCKGVFAAISTGGVIFAYQGFEQAIQLGGESRTRSATSRSRWSTSMVLGVVIYIAAAGRVHRRAEPERPGARLDHVAFAATAPPGRSPGSRRRSGSAGCAILLYIDAVISPGGTGLLYIGTSARVWLRARRARATSRSVFAMLPRAASRTSRSRSRSRRDGRVPAVPGLAEARRLHHVGDSARLRLAPLALAALRREEPDLERPFRLPGGRDPRAAVVHRRERADPVLGVGGRLEAARRDR